MSDAADHPEDVDSVAEVRALRGERDEIDAKRAEAGQYSSADDAVMDEGYRQLVQQTTPEEAAEDRAITMSRRRRQAEEDAAAQ